MSEDEKWMKIALEQASIGFDKGEVPVGAVLIQKNNIVSKAFNCPISENDPTAHAEIMAIRLAGEKINNYRHPKSTLYVTLEPCIMCLGAIIHSRIERVVFGAYDSKNEFLKPISYSNSKILINSKVIIHGGVMENDCRQKLDLFFKSKRKNTT